jgi:hypothetical protein
VGGIVWLVCRIDQPDPVAAWQSHISDWAGADSLDERQYRALHLTAPGTDLTIGLSERHRWMGEASTAKLASNSPEPTDRRCIHHAASPAYRRPRDVFKATQLHRYPGLKSYA